MEQKYLSVNEYAKNKGISLSKVKKMAPYIQDAYQCSYCKKWLIPQNATALFVPDKRLYSNQTKKYCYVMDAICEGALIDSRIDGLNLSEKECPTIVRELKEHGKITLLEGCSEDSLDYRDYIPSIDGWMSLSSKQKTDLLLEILKTTQELAKTIQAVV